MREPITADDVLFLAFELECNFAWIMDIDAWLRAKQLTDNNAKLLWASDDSAYGRLLGHRIIIISPRQFLQCEKHLMVGKI